MSERFDELNEAADGRVRRAVAYLRFAVQGPEGIVALAEQQNAGQRFADLGGYGVDRWYVEGDGVELEGDALD